MLEHRPFNCNLGILSFLLPDLLYNEDLFLLINLSFFFFLNIESFTIHTLPEPLPISSAWSYVHQWLQYEWLHLQWDNINFSLAAETAINPASDLPLWPTYWLPLFTDPHWAISAIIWMRELPSNQHVIWHLGISHWLSLFLANF